MPALPDPLTPEAVDRLVAKLPDAEIRALLLEELGRRAAAEAAVETDTTLMAAGERLQSMAATIEERLGRWFAALGNLGERRERVAERLALASGGVPGMVLGFVLLAAAGLGAAFAVGLATAGWRRSLASPAGEAGYWERVARTMTLGALEIAAVVTFVVATVSAAPILSGLLGPLIDYVWIWHVGVSYSWAAALTARRAFAPDTPAIRVAPVSDSAAGRISGTVSRAVALGTAGWLTAGLFPTLGWGFPPALLTVAAAGTAVAALLLMAVWRHRAALREGMLRRLDGAGGAGGGGGAVALAAPWLLALYVFLAWGYWLAHWLETGQTRLTGPVGTLVVLMALPLLDRLGAECIAGMVRTPSAAGERYRTVLTGAWRAVLTIGAVLLIAWLWGLDILALAKGPEASPWISALFDIAVTLMLGHLVWRLIRAALWSEARAAAGGEDDTGVEATRLDTLLPLIRTVLLSIVVAVVAMIVLSSLGVDIGPLLASAGIVGIAVGFGAQNLVRDVFSGAFFLVDDAFRVGEYIELDQEIRGEVESITVRSLQLRHHKGAVITIPFGEVRQVINHNRDWVIYKMNFRLEPETDPLAVKKVVKRVGAELMEHPEHGPKFIEPLKSQGVLMIDDDSALVIRVKFKCRPRAQFVLRREVYHALRTEFAEAGIHFARRKVEVVSTGDVAAPGLPDDLLDPGDSAAPVR